MSSVNRFFIEGTLQPGQTFQFDRDTAHQVRHVLRLRPGEPVILLDNSGFQFGGAISALDPVLVKLDSRESCPGEPRVDIHLFFGLLKGDKLDYVLEKGTELGVIHFHPMITVRCVARDPGESKLLRWERIVKEAAEQSGRGRLPRVDGVTSFNEACRQAAGIGLIPWEEERSGDLRVALAGAAETVSLFIGPEGGFDSGEIDFARQCGLKPVTLGTRILRADTASIASVTAVLFQLGQFG
jgi:16S rRNA (uracil1498-N3)-methyltransferase